MNAVNRLLVLVAALLVSACGGSALEAGVGSGGSGAPVEPLSVGIGSIAGFGSIIVNGVRYDETAAEILVDLRPDRPSPAAVSALRLGSHVELRHRAQVIERATVAAELIGPVASVGAASFVALGQTVRVNGDAAHPTVFDGFSALSDLAQGAVVEVHGDRAPSGEILATRVQLQPASLALTRISGIATLVDGRRFSIGALSVDTASAQILPAGAALAAGQRVVAWTDAAYGGGALVAKIVRIETPMIAENASVTLDGVVAELRGGPSFRVGAVEVDGSSAAITGGTAADLANGRSIRVRGPFVGDVLKAAAVEILPSAPSPIQLTGAITDFVDPANPFRIRDSLVRVTAQTTYVGGSADNLGTGVQVKASGPLVDGVVLATSVEFLALPAGPQRTVVGVVTAPVSPIAGDGSRTFRLDAPAMNVKTSASTAYRNGSPSEVAVGRHVSVRGRLEGDLFLADEIRFLDNPAAPATVEIDGTAGNVQATSLVVNGQEVRLTAGTTYTLDGSQTSSASLRNGVQVQIVAARAADGLLAISVEIRSPERAAASVRGIVSGRTPPDATQFLVGSQRVNVGANPVVIPASKSLADIVNGADVEVEGTISGGVLTATRIKLR